VSPYHLSTQEGQPETEKPHASDCLKVYRIRNPAANDNVTHAPGSPARACVGRGIARFNPSVQDLSTAFIERRSNSATPAETAHRAHIPGQPRMQENHKCPAAGSRRRQPTILL
jgi:hypothetical protein